MVHAGVDDLGKGGHELVSFQSTSYGLQCLDLSVKNNCVTDRNPQTFESFDA